MTPEPVSIIEVGPRDGLQYEAAATALSVEDKIAFIERLAAAGLTRIEAGSFVSPKAVPQMAGSAEVAARLSRHPLAEGVQFSYLVPNRKGLDMAAEAGVSEIAVFVAASDAFSLANINATVEESFVRLAEVFREAPRLGMRVRGYVSTIFGGPKGEVITPARVTAVAQRLLDNGVFEVSLGDTTGIGTPETTEELLRAFERAGIPKAVTALHFHDTGGRAIDNVAVAYDMGIRTFDSSAGGLGGCPYAESPRGNVATEDVVWFLEERRGLVTGIDREALRAASAFMLAKIGKASQARCGASPE